MKGPNQRAGELGIVRGREDALHYRRPRPGHIPFYVADMAERDAWVLVSYAEGYRIGYENAFDKEN